MLKQLHETKGPRRRFRDAEAAVRRSGERYVLTHSADLLRMMRQTAGDDGAAAILAFRDIVLGGEFAPEVWPVDDLLDLLDASDPMALDVTVMRMRRNLVRLAKDIDGLAVMRLQVRIGSLPTTR